MHRDRSGIAAALLLCLAASANAQGTGRALDLDTSIRSSGMGGASGAVFWGGDPNEWANPALLGYHRGLRYSYGRTQLLPGLAEDIVFTTKRFTLGAGGIGFLMAGAPVGTVHLDYGASPSTDDTGNPISSFSTWEDIQAWGVGASASELIRTFTAINGTHAPEFTRHVDIAAGFAHKDIDIVLGPAALGGEASGTGLDWGVLGRVTPIDLDPSAALPVRFDVSFGASVLNFNDERVVFSNADIANPLSRFHRHGAAGRLAIGVPAALRSTLSPRAGWLWDSLDPLVSIAVSDDIEHITAGDLNAGYKVHREGFELIVANIFSFRRGHVLDRDGGIDGDTSGYGWGLHLGRFAGFRYDHAAVPQIRAAELPDVEREGYTLFVDLMALRQP